MCDMVGMLDFLWVPRAKQTKHWGEALGAFHQAKEDSTCNSAISKHVVWARILVEMGSHPTKRFLFNHTTPFSTKDLEKSLCAWFHRNHFCAVWEPCQTESAWCTRIHGLFASGELSRTHKNIFEVLDSNSRKASISGWIMCKFSSNVVIKQSTVDGKI